MVTAKPAATKPAPAPRKPAAKVATPPVAPIAAPKKSPATQTALSTEQRNHYVEVAAFYIAERRGFAPSDPGQDWAAAEIEVDRLFASGHFSG